MIDTHKTFSSYSVNQIETAKKFYGEILGLEVQQDAMGLNLFLRSGGRVFLYEKPDHQPATFTVLNFVVADIDQTVDLLSAKGIQFEKYEGILSTDAKGIMRSHSPETGPSIAWFKDPAGNFLSIIED